VLRTARSLGRTIRLSIVLLLLCVVPFLLFAWAEQHIDSGLASIFNVTTPLMTIVVALLALPEERPTRARLAGLATGFVGVLVVLGPWRGLRGGGAAGQLACLLATACYGIAFVYLRRFVAPRGLPAISAATVQVGVSAVLMLVLSPFLPAHPVHLTWRVTASVLALGILGTGTPTSGTPMWSPSGRPGHRRLGRGGLGDAEPDRGASRGGRLLQRRGGVGTAGLRR